MTKDCLNTSAVRAAVLVAALVALTISGAGLAQAQQVFGRGPAPTISVADSPSRRVDENGFLQRWLILEPISVPGQLGDSAIRAAVETEYFEGQFDAVPDHGDSVTVGDQVLTWHAVDSSLYNVNLFHFSYALEPPTSNVLFWAVTVVDVPETVTDVRLAIGSNAASIWWVNGEEVIGIYNDRQTVIDDGVSQRLQLNPGRNVIRAAIINAGGATDFCARLLGSDYEPITDLEIRLGMPD